MDAERARLVRCGDFDLDVRAGELRKHGVRIRLPAQSFRILLMLLERSGEVVLREEIRLEAVAQRHHRRVRPEYQCRHHDWLRNALGESAEEPRYIETLAKRGYRFVGKAKPGDLPAS